LTDLPAGYSSSEEEYLDPDEEDDESLSCSRTKEIQNPVKSGKLMGPANCTVQEPVANVSFASGFLWTRNSCAKRAETSGQKQSEKVSESFPVSFCQNALSQNAEKIDSLHHECAADSSSSFCRPTKKTPVNCNTNDGVNWLWVEKVLKDAVNKAVAPQGSEEVVLCVVLLKIFCQLQKFITYVC
jgi:hypothetical protein